MLCPLLLRIHQGVVLETEDILNSARNMNHYKEHEFQSSGSSKLRIICLYLLFTLIASSFCLPSFVDLSLATCVTAIFSSSHDLEPNYVKLL